MPHKKDTTQPRLSRVAGNTKTKHSRPDNKTAFNLMQALSGIDECSINNSLDHLVHVLNLFKEASLSKGGYINNPAISEKIKAESASYLPSSCKLVLGELNKFTSEFNSYAKSISLTSGDKSTYIGDNA